MLNRDRSIKIVRRVDWPSQKFEFWIGRRGYDFQTDQNCILNFLKISYQFQNFLESSNFRKIQYFPKTEQKVEVSITASNELSEKLFKSSGTFYKLRNNVSINC